MLSVQWLSLPADAVTRWVIGEPVRVIGGLYGPQEMGSGETRSMVQWQVCLQADIWRCLVKISFDKTISGLEELQSKGQGATFIYFRQEFI